MGFNEQNYTFYPFFTELLAKIIFSQEALKMEIANLLWYKE